MVAKHISDDHKRWKDVMFLYNKISCLDAAMSYKWDFRH